MSKDKVTETVEKIVEPITNDLGFELVDVEFVKEGGNWFLRIYIDKEGGIDLEDCEKVSRSLDVILDEKDPIPQNYFLEVSSPGLDRPLKKDADFEKFKGSLVKVKTFGPIDGKKEFIGNLVGLAGDMIILDMDKNQIEIPKDKASSVRLEVTF